MNRELWLGNQCKPEIVGVLTGPMNNQPDTTQGGTDSKLCTDDRFNGEGLTRPLTPTSKKR